MKTRNEKLTADVAISVNVKMKISDLLRLFFIFYASLMDIASCSKPEKPNILFIMSDDHGYVTEILTKLSIDWLKNRVQRKPFFLMIHHKAPHRSWMPANKNQPLFDNKEFPLPANFYDSYQGGEGLQNQMPAVKDHMDIRMK